jgi:type IX secretion system PorP/SprF family membrane protein
MGFSGVEAPTTFLINAHAPLGQIFTGSTSSFVKSSAAGISFYNDKLGFETNNAVRLSYAYHQPIGVGTLSGGLSIGIFNKSLGKDWVAPEIEPGQDRAIPQGGVSNSTYDISLGAYYSTNKLYVGLSSTHLTQSGLNYESNDYDLDMKMERHYYVMAGYDYLVGGSQKFIIKPAILAKSDASSTQIDVSARLLYDKMIWGGLSYRPGDAVAPMAGYRQELSKGVIKAGVSYDATTSRLNNYSNGTIEFMVNYCFNVEPPVKKREYRSVRFM